MDLRIGSSILSTMKFTSNAWSDFHERARKYGEQSESAKRTSERICAIALAAEFCALTTLTGAATGAAISGPPGIAVGAATGLTLGVAGSAFALSFEIESWSAPDYALT